MTEEKLRYHLKFDNKGNGYLFCNDDLIAKRHWNSKDAAYFWHSDLLDIQEIIDIWGRWSTAGGLIEAIKRYRKQN